MEIYLIYNKTCLIRPALGEIFCVGTDRMSDYNTQCKTHRSKGHENQHWITQDKGLHSVKHKELSINVGYDRVTDYTGVG